MDQVMPLLLPLLLLRGGVEEVLGMEMVSRLPMKGTITKEGSPLTLSCASSAPWFFCLWHSPVGGKQCAIQEDQVAPVNIQICFCKHQELWCDSSNNLSGILNAVDYMRK